MSAATALMPIPGVINPVPVRRGPNPQRSMSRNNIGDSGNPVCRSFPWIATRGEFAA